jgi:serine/threonine-protein kinase
MSAWLREAYFAELLGREPRALKVFDRFPVSEGSGMRYCLAMEYAEHGDLGAWLAHKGPQSERFVRREIAAVLGALSALHQGQAMHRDLTPFNVFVCKDEQLKLGDFGIAAHQLNRRGVTADAFNQFHVPTEIAWGSVRRWQQRDDIYQVGLIASMLLRGDISSAMRSRDVRGLPCSDQLKEVIHRCLGVRGKRYEAAAELIAALRQRVPKLHLGRIRSLEGKRVSFTGFLSRPRSEAIAAAKKAGAIVQGKPGQTTDVLVRGRPNALQIAGTVGGLKLMEVRQQAAKGHPVTLIGDAQFWKLVEPTSRSRKVAHPAKAAPRRRGSARSAPRASKKSDVGSRRLTH